MRGTACPASHGGRFLFSFFFFFHLKHNESEGEEPPFTMVWFPRSCYDRERRGESGSDKVVSHWIAMYS